MTLDVELLHPLHGVDTTLVIMSLTPCWLGVIFSSINLPEFDSYRAHLSGYGCRLTWCCYVSTCRECSINYWHIPSQSLIKLIWHFVQDLLCCCCCCCCKVDREGMRQIVGFLIFAYGLV